MIDAWTVDFETYPIGPRPEHFPPKPVGVSIRRPTGEKHYYSWGHPTGNNCTFEDAATALAEVYNSPLPIVFHHAKFDMSILYEWFDWPKLPWERFHDTMFQAFLIDPYARTIGLKQLAVRYLGMDPNEQDVVVQYILDHKEEMPLFEFVINSKGEPFGKPTKKNAGAWIAFVPAELVGPYANGDVERTWRLFQVFSPVIEEAGMVEAYDVERQVQPIFYENERDGLRVNVDLLRQDTEIYQAAFQYAEDWLRWKLNVPGLNFDADAEVSEVLFNQGIVTNWATTKTGKRSMSKTTLHPRDYSDQDVAQMLGYRNRLKTCLKMFMLPWLKQASINGRISTNWNQVQSPEGGTRTGRPSATKPNLLNISKNFEGRPDGYEHPTDNDSAGLPPLPLVRKYILADDGCVLLKRDFSGQELRMFAHFEQGALLAQYKINPKLDVHQYVGENFAALTGQTHWVEPEARTELKAMNFQGMYGGGAPALALALFITIEKARELKAFHNRALPGRKILSDTLSTVLRSGYAVRTWGGRLYNRPPLKMVDGRMRDFDYRMINYLIQGSAADMTKRAMIKMVDHPDYDARFMLQVYDEINISAAPDKAVKQMQVLHDVMGDMDLRVKILSDGSIGMNWGEMKKINDDNTLESRLLEFGV